MRRCRGNQEGTAVTLDNTLSSRPTIDPPATRQAMVVSPLAPPRTNLCRAGNCTNLASAVEAYVEAGIAPATRRAYRADLDHWGPGAYAPGHRGSGCQLPSRPSAATAFSACRPEDAKSHPNKMFELSGYRDATTAGNWRHRNLPGTLCIRPPLVGVGAPRRTSGCWRRHEGAALPLANIIVRLGARGLPASQARHEP